jgi:hypothetical protein
VAFLLGVVCGAVTHYLGLLATTLGRFDEAEARFTAAAAAHRRMGAVIWLSRTRLEWARMLLAREAPGDRARASELLQEVLATAEQFGLANLRRCAGELLDP